jgi:DNA gyrase subunit B
LQELAFLNGGVKIVFKDRRTGSGETFHYSDGIVEFIRFLNRASEAAHEDVVFFVHDKTIRRASRSKSPSNTAASITENVHCYANNINAPSTAARTSPVSARP